MNREAFYPSAALFPSPDGCSAVTFYHERQMKYHGIPDIQTVLVFTQCEEVRTMDYPLVSEYFECKHRRRLTFMVPKAGCPQMMECYSFLFSVLLLKL